MTFREFLNEGRIKKISKWENFVKKTINGTGGHAFIWVNGDWSEKTVDVDKYMKDNVKSSVLFKQSGITYEWVHDKQDGGTGFIEVL